ncbi:MAG: dephospho-CoA kinase [Gammaproteobacteria bacterium]|nr:dephospho-CoA kinase [Gammaproteobacteria bacterium]
MLTIGLTGGVGSGKSTVADLFKALGVPVYDTDAIARDLVEPGQPALQEIISVFGNDIIDASGRLNRQKLKRQVFSNAADRNKLESILHPRIRESLLAKIQCCTASYCVAVIPLLVEKHWQDIVDRVLLVDVSEATQIQRTQQRDKISESLIKRIIKTQASRDERLAAADDVIDNNGAPDTLRIQVEQLHKKYLKLAQQQ